MLCVNCWSPADGLCVACAALLIDGRSRVVGPGLVVWTAFEHRGLARRLVHDLKYRGLVGRAAIFAPAMVARLPPATRLLVPVPRTPARRLALGVDPAPELAVAVSRMTGLRVCRLLAPALWQVPHAGKSRSRRPPARFTPRLPAPPGTVLVDDVVTTGATLGGAATALGSGVIGAVTATGAGV